MKIDSRSLRIFKIVHTWTGLMAGLLLFLAFYAGALTIFREDIAIWQGGRPHQMTEDALPMSTALLAAVTDAHEAARRGMMINLPDGHESGVEALWRTPDGETHHARLGPDGGLVMGSHDGGRLSMVIDQLHRTAGIPGLPGELLLGTVAFIYGLALLSGVILYLPVIGRDLFALRWGRNLQLLWKDAHNSIGILSLPFHILFALTGAVMSVHDPLFMGMDALIYGDQGRAMLMRTALPVAVPKPEGVAAAVLPTEDLVARARLQVPDFVPHHLIFNLAGDRAGVVTLMGDQPDVLGHTIRIALSSVSGELLAIETADARPTGMSALSTMAALHFADYGGRQVQWLYFALGLAGAFLFYTGNLLWLEARRRRRGMAPPWHHSALARLTVGFCLGTCVATSALFVIARLPADLGSWDLLTSFWAVVLMALLWSGLRQPAAGARDLLIAASVMSAAIPVSSMLIGAERARAGLGVDLAAFGAALIFAGLAHRVIVRSRRTHGASVWDGTAGEGTRVGALGH